MPTSTVPRRPAAPLAAVTAMCAAGCFTTLRAASDGPAPSSTLIALGGVLLALLLWPFAARSTGVATLSAVLAVAQLGAHMLTLAAAGSLAPGSARAVVCCPPTPALGSGPVDQLTAQAGWWLLAVQLLACVLLALLLQGSRTLLDISLDALALLRECVAAVLLPGRRLLLALLKLLVPVVQRLRVGPVLTALPVRGVGLVLATATARRGPPVAARRRPATRRPSLSPGLTGG